jgi:hypothetical protein
MRRSARDRAEVRIVWRGGATTEFTVMMPVNSLTALSRGAEMEQRVCEFANAGQYDEEIAQILTAEGHRSPWRDTEVLSSTVRGIRLRHGIRHASPNDDTGNCPAAEVLAMAFRLALEAVRGVVGGVGGRSISAQQSRNGDRC